MWSELGKNGGQHWVCGKDSMLCILLSILKIYSKCCRYSTTMLSTMIVTKNEPCWRWYHSFELHVEHISCSSREWNLFCCTTWYHPFINLKNSGLSRCSIGCSGRCCVVWRQERWLQTLVESYKTTYMEIDSIYSITWEIYRLVHHLCNI